MKTRRESIWAYKPANDDLEPQTAWEHLQTLTEDERWSMAADLIAVRREDRTEWAAVYCHQVAAWESVRLDPDEFADALLQWLSGESAPKAGGDR